MEEKKMEKLEILVVDDLEENRIAAKQYFDSIGIKVDFAVDFESGKEKLEQKDYYFAIFDLEMPNKEGKLGDFGYELEKFAFDKYKIPSAVLTGKMADKSHGVISSILMDGKHQGSAPIKTDVEAWEKTYKTIEEHWKPQYLWNSKKQYNDLLRIRFQEST
jgi:CheY-like chemotaxis protein